MATALIKDRIGVKTKDEALKLHLTIKSYQHNLNLSQADIDTLVELNRLGYNKEFYTSCLEKSFYKSEQTVMNAISRMTTMGILSCKKRGERTINPDYLPDVSEDKVIFNYLVGNL